MCPGSGCISSDLRRVRAGSVNTNLPPAKTEELRKRIDRELDALEQKAPHLADLFGQLSLREVIAVYTERKRFVGLLSASGVIVGRYQTLCKGAA